MAYFINLGAIIQHLHLAVHLHQALEPHCQAEDNAVVEEAVGMMVEQICGRDTEARVCRLLGD